MLAHVYVLEEIYSDETGAPYRRIFQTCAGASAAALAIVQAEVEGPVTHADLGWSETVPGEYWVTEEDIGLRIERLPLET